MAPGGALLGPGGRVVWVRRGTTGGAGGIHSGTRSSLVSRVGGGGTRRRGVRLHVVHGRTDVRDAGDGVAVPARERRETGGGEDLEQSLPGARRPQQRSRHPDPDPE